MGATSDDADTLGEIYLFLKLIFMRKLLKSRLGIYFIILYFILLIGFVSYHIIVNTSGWGYAVAGLSLLWPWITLFKNIPEPDSWIIIILAFPTSLLLNCAIIYQVGLMIEKLTKRLKNK